MKLIMDIHEVMKYLPHRYPFLLVDGVIAMEPAKSIVALKNVSINEPFFQGHFPGRPVMPGVLIIEALAQAATILAYKSTDTFPSSGVKYYFAGIDSARFRRVVEPGDQLELKIQLLRVKQDIWKLSGEAFVDGQLACSSEFLSAKRNKV